MDFNTTFFFRFPSRALLKGFHVLKMTARKGILTFTVRSLSLAEQHFILFEDHDSDSDLWFVLHRMTPPSSGTSCHLFRIF